VNCQTWKKCQIKYDKDTSKINSFFSFHGSYIVSCKGKPTVTAFNREPEFKTENLIKYRIQCRHYDKACVCEGGATTEACVTQFWATLNLYYWKQYSLLITRLMTRVWGKLITHFKQNCVLLMRSNKKILPKTTSSVLKMLFLLLKIYKTSLITGSVSPLIDGWHLVPPPV